MALLAAMIAVTVKNDRHAFKLIQGLDQLRLLHQGPFTVDFRSQAQVSQAHTPGVVTGSRQQQHLAQTLWRWVKPGGGVLWLQCAPPSADGVRLSQTPTSVVITPTRKSFS